MTNYRTLPLLAFGAALHAQSEADLKRFFEGKQVTVKIDMPGTQLGIDVYPNREQALDAGRYGYRMKSYGTAIRNGDTVMVTKVHVTKKNIEFQLAGGGYGTFGDSTSLPSYTSLSKTSYERDLERDLSRAQTDDERRRIRSALDRERSHRRRMDDRNRAATDLARVEKERLILDRRAQGGSRFNILYEQGRLEESVPTPGEVMRILGEWVDFRGLSYREPPRAASVAPPPPRPAPPAPPPAAVATASSKARRGMSRDEVHAALGRPSSSRQGKQGTLSTLVERFDSAATEVTYVADVVVNVSGTAR
jgi:hypothetical protein